MRKIDYGKFQLIHDDDMWRVEVAGVSVGHIFRDDTGATWAYGRWRILGDRRMVEGGNGSARVRQRRAYGYNTARIAAHQLAVMNSGMVISEICRRETAAHEVA